MRVSLTGITTLSFLLASMATLHAQTAPKSPVPIDFSYAGYGAGASIPTVPAVLRVAPSGGDDTDLLQQALDRVAAMPQKTDGFRGALLLAPGRFRVRGQ